MNSRVCSLLDVLSWTSDGGEVERRVVGGGRAPHGQRHAARALRQQHAAAAAQRAPLGRQRDLVHHAPLHLVLDGARAVVHVVPAKPTHPPPHYI